MNSYAMGLRYRLSIEDAADEGAGEGVASTYGVGNLHFRCFLERHAARCEDIAAVNATSKHKHVEIVLAQDEPTLVLNV